MILTLRALAALQDTGFHIPDIWLGALLSLAVVGITIAVGLQISQRSTVIRVDEWIFGDGRNQKGAAAELRELTPKMWHAVAQVEELSTWKDESERREQQRLTEWDRRWQEFLRQQRSV